MIVTKEPPHGLLLAGDRPSDKPVYERDDAAAASQGDTVHRWFNVADPDDVYTFDDLLADYKQLTWYVPATVHPE